MEVTNATTLAQAMETSRQGGLGAMRTSVRGQGNGVATGLDNATGTELRHHEPYSGAVLLFVVMFLAASQLVLQAWRSRHPRTFNQATLAGLWLIPFGLACQHMFWRFVGVWVVFTLGAAFFVRKATQTPLAPSTPRQVYTFFSVVYKACYYLGVAGYCACVLQGMIGPLSRRIVEYSLLAMFYGMYFGLLGRDAAEVCAERMSATLGYIGKKDDDAGREPPPANICCLCGNAMEQHRGDVEATEQLVELPCGHTYHEFCMLGWTIVGKKDTCPFCGDRVQLSKLAITTSWRTPSVTWSWLLGLVRYFMSWHPIVLAILHFMFLELGLTH